MSANPWKPCDLRGEYPIAVSEDLFARVGAAIGTQLNAGACAIVAGDFRLSTPALKAALINGLVSSGICVTDAGQIPTPVAYFAKRQTKADALLVVTASHNPPADNGLKIMIGNLPPTEAQLAEIRALSESENFRNAVGSVQRLDPVGAYRDWIVSRWRGVPNSKIALDAGHGAWSHIAPEVFRRLGFEAICIHCEPDGRFPSRPPDCARTPNLSALRRVVVEHGAQLGIAWDGDGDRVAFVDHTGRHASTDEISILLARRVLNSAVRSEVVVCDVKLSDAVRRAVVDCGARAVSERSGHAFMRSRMLGEQALLGLDACGHYFFRELEFGDDGLFAALTVIDLVQSAGSLASLRETAGPIFSTPELRVPVALMNHGEIVNRLRLEFPEAVESNVDGARYEFEHGVLLARRSSTEPMVSLRVEGFSQTAYDDLLARCLDSLDSVAPLLRRQIEETTG